MIRKVLLRIHLVRSQRVHIPEPRSCRTIPAAGPAPVAAVPSPRSAPQTALDSAAPSDRAALRRSLQSGHSDTPALALPNPRYSNCGASVRYPVNSKLPLAFVRITRRPHHRNHKSRRPNQDAASQPRRLVDLPLDLRRNRPVERSRIVHRPCPCKLSIVSFIKVFESRLQSLTSVSSVVERSLVGSCPRTSVHRRHRRRKITPVAQHTSARHSCR